ncbi:MAG TPA: hypothetical protein VGP24_03160, partial [Glaciihabitans sp.]|nr:hypothetical protein [Glaciihabitans sp.]
ITAGGPTRFATSSDDGTAIFIDGIRVVNNNFFQGFTERQGTIDLTPGLHDIVMYFYEGGGGAGFTASYQPVGATALAPIPNNVLYSGEVNTSASTLPIVVTGNSGLEIAAGSATLGALDVAGGSTLSVLGTGTFAGTTLSGAGNYGFSVKSRTDQVNLGPITGAGKTINKSGEGALVFSSTAPANLTVNATAGLVVIQGGDDGAITTNPLGTSTVNLSGGGIGFSSTVGNPTYTTNVAGGASSYRIEAGRFGSLLLDSSITWAPQNNTFAIANGATATLSSRNLGYSLTVVPAVTGQGALVLEQGTINFSAAGGVTNSGGVTVQGATVNVAGPVNTGALNVTGNALGVDNFNPAVTIAGAVTATSVSVARGTLNVAGQTTNAGTLTQTGGTTNLNANSSHGAVAVSGGVLSANADLVATGAFTVSGGSAIVAGAATAGSVAVSGGSAQFQSPLTTTTVAVTGGNLTVGDLNASGGASVSGIGSSLNFNSGAARTISGNVSVTNQGSVRAQSGITEMGQGVITVAPRQFQAGLVEGLLTNIGDLNGGNPGVTLPNPGTGRPGTGGVQLWPRMGETNQKDATHWADNEVWVYTGQIFDADGVFTFAENIDDRVRVKIDGVTVLSNDAWDVPTTSGGTQGYGMGVERNGWHDIEIRFHNGGGGAGTVGTFGWGGGDNANYLNKGFGFNVGETISTSGGDYIIPQDPGDMTLFRTVVEGGGSVRVDGGATLKTGAITGAQAIVLDGINDVAVLQLNNHTVATPSSSDVLSVPGAGTVSLGDNNTLTVGVISANDGFLVLNKADGAGTGGTVRVTGAITGGSGLLSSNIGAGTLNVQGVRLVLNSALQGTGALTASAGGVVAGTGSIAGSLAANAGGTIAPGDNGIGLLTVGSLAITGGKLQLEISSTDSYDALTVLTGGVNLTGGTLEGLLTNFTMTPGQVIYVINNLGAGPVVGTFAGAPDGSTMTFGARQFQVSYDAIFNGSFDSGGNDVALRLIPEPGALSSLLGGVGMLCGLQRFRRRRA